MEEVVLDIRMENGQVQQFVSDACVDISANTSGLGLA
jgi:hypothetical protein